MEIVGSIASILSITEATLKIARKSKRLLKDYKEAHKATYDVEQELSNIQESIDRFRLPCPQIQNDVFRMTLSPPDSGLPLTNGLEQLSSGLETLREAYHHNPDKPFTARNRVRWALQGHSLVDEAQKKLETAKSTFLLCLESLTVIQLAKQHQLMSEILVEQRTMEHKLDKILELLPMHGRLHNGGVVTQSAINGMERKEKNDETLPKESLMKANYCSIKLTNSGVESHSPNMKRGSQATSADLYMKTQQDTSAPPQLSSDTDVGHRIGLTAISTSTTTEKEPAISSIKAASHPQINNFQLSLPALGIFGRISIFWDEHRAHYTLHIQIRLPWLLGKGVFISDLGFSQYRLARSNFSLQSNYIGLVHYVPEDSSVFQAVEMENQMLLRSLLKEGRAGLNDRFPVKEGERKWWRGETTILAVSSLYQTSSFKSHFANFKISLL